MKAFRTFAHVSHMDVHFCAYAERCGCNTVAHTHLNVGICKILFQALHIRLTPPPPFPLWHMEEV